MASQVGLPKLLGEGPTSDRTSAFRFDSSRVPLGRVLHYRKSTIDGSQIDLKGHLKTGQ
jgi:hypothetical protein